MIRDQEPLAGAPSPELLERRYRVAQLTGWAAICGLFLPPQITAARMLGAPAMISFLGPLWVVGPASCTLPPCPNGKRGGCILIPRIKNGKKRTASEHFLPLARNSERVESLTVM